jgi:hypothetical protein
MTRQGVAACRISILKGERVRDGVLAETQNVVGLGARDRSIEHELHTRGAVLSTPKVGEQREAVLALDRDARLHSQRRDARSRDDRQPCATAASRAT